MNKIEKDELHEAFYAHTDSDRAVLPDYDGESWSNFMAGWMAGKTFATPATPSANEGVGTIDTHGFRSMMDYFGRAQTIGQHTERLTAIVAHIDQHVAAAVVEAETRAYQRGRLAAIDDYRETLEQERAKLRTTPAPVSAAPGLERALGNMLGAVGNTQRFKAADEARAALKEYRASLPSAGAPADSFQQRVQPWMMACFGEMIAGDREERNHRFLEEALELVQSCGCSADEAHQLVDYVFGRDIGDPPQEVGGVMVTLAALCLANGLDMHDCAEVELARIWTKVEAIRAKQAAKPKYGPLPGPSVSAGAPLIAQFGRADYREGVKAGAPVSAADQFCDANCTWRDHAPGCERAEAAPVSGAEQARCGWEGCPHGADCVHAKPADVQELPALPEMNLIVTEHPGIRFESRGYTNKQMHDYARAALATAMRQQQGDSHFSQSAPVSSPTEGNV